MQGEEPLSSSSVYFYVRVTSHVGKVHLFPESGLWCVLFKPFVAATATVIKSFISIDCVDIINQAIRLE